MVGTAYVHSGRRRAARVTNPLAAATSLRCRAALARGDKRGAAVHVALQMDVVHQCQGALGQLIGGGPVELINRQVGAASEGVDGGRERAQIRGDVNGMGEDRVGSLDIALQQRGHTFQDQRTTTGVAARRQPIASDHGVGAHPCRSGRAQMSAA